MDIAGAAVLVTGARSGLGAATASHLAGLGAWVYGVDLPSDTDVPITPHVTLHSADVTDEAGLRTVLAAIAADGHTLRAAVSCAGIAPSARLLGRRGPHDLTIFERTVHVNLIGTFNVMRLAAEVIATNGPDGNGQRGVIVNTASIAAYEPQIGQAAYAASKAGVIALGLAAARDLAAHGIRVVTIAPGIVDTPMMAGFSAETRAALSASVPFPNRLARPDEYADLVAVALRHDYLNGETIRMDGALRMNPN